MAVHGRASSNEFACRSRSIILNPKPTSGAGCIFKSTCREAGRCADLVAVLEALLEHAVLIADAIAPRRQVESRHRVEEASGKAAKTAVAEGSVLLLLDQVLELVADLLERVLVRMLKVEVHERVEERASHEELKREVVDTLGILLDVVRLGVAERFDEVVAHRVRHRLIRRVHIEVVTVGREGVLRMMHNRPAARKKKDENDSAACKSTKICDDAPMHARASPRARAMNFEHHHPSQSTTTPLLPAGAACAAEYLQGNRRAQGSPLSFRRRRGWCDGAGTHTHFWMDVLSAGLYCAESDQIFLAVALSPAGPGRFTLGLDRSCCEAERVSVAPWPPRRDRFVRLSVTDAGRGAAHAELAVASTTAANRWLTDACISLG